MPNFLQLVNIDLPSRIGPKIKVFGTLLLQDKHGDKMDVIRANHQGRPEDMGMEVLRKWLAGKGVEVTWESLMATLKEKQTTSYGRTDTNGIGPTKILIMFRH